jgi:hypothetical protein
MTSTRLHVSTLWGTSSGLYKVLKTFKYINAAWPDGIPCGGYSVSVEQRVNTMTVHVIMDAWLILVVIYVTLNLYNFIFAIHFCKMYFVVTTVGMIISFGALVLC